MEYISYKLSFLDGQQVVGNASKIVVKDRHNVMSILRQSAPILSVLDSGKIEIFDEKENITEYSFQEGFLNASHNQCVMTILKY